ncbi:hypothetical protein GPLA_1825 [Paraglaciecola polaris LMG 21857]|uniref:Uncharacterized protein n=1 Tax=Paraglaciecola polaris LMG 21857 TaxID=1129793 RepID=K6ZR14_9ALTE|nr:hypothetical protein GPLA_1825 [Paraglaciecola polaris LMG 21857]
MPSPAAATATFAASPVVEQPYGEYWEPLSFCSSKFPIEILLTRWFLLLMQTALSG